MKAVLNGGVSEPELRHTDCHVQLCSDFFATPRAKPAVPLEADDMHTFRMLVTDLFETRTLQETTTALAISAGSFMASSLATVATPAAGMTVTVACMPWLPPFLYQWWTQEESEAEPQSPGNTLQRAAEASSRARGLSWALTMTGVTQAACGMVQFVLDDPLTGVIGMAISTLGLQSAQPAGYRYLPTYIVLAFCNGTMQALMMTETLASGGLGAVHYMGMLGKAAAVSWVMSPVLCFTGLAIGWNLYGELCRELARHAPPAVADVRDTPPTQGRAPLAASRRPATTRSVRTSQEDPSEQPFVPFTGGCYRILQAEDAEAEKVEPRR
eukprot:gb/GFBE01067100.1/.p1 GENE.gb/GFBE01067100.1/~~gb/GFBE01067100.1/.p1  ORF type:complete len:327 (+),score=44.30 gb/GFBE01067100.1/:1-981(+)